MTDSIEALLAVREHGTMSAAAGRLRITQSAVSKRIALLEGQLPYRLIEHRGRNVRLSARGLRFAERAAPLLVELRAVMREEEGDEGGELTLAVSESVLASWGALALARVKGEMGKTRLVIRSHRSPLVVEQVRSGACALGICAGDPGPHADLRAEEIAREPMVIVPSGLRPARLARTMPVISIEEHSATWRSLRPRLKALAAERGVRITVGQEAQSFACIVQMARAGMGHGLVPEGIALAMGLSRASLLAVPGLERPVSLIGRASAFAAPVVRVFLEELRKAARRRTPGR